MHQLKWGMIDHANWTVLPLININIRAIKSYVNDQDRSTVNLTFVPLIENGRYTSYISDNGGE